MDLLFSIKQADRFGQAFSEAILASFPDLRPSVTTKGGDPSGFGPIKISEVVVRTDNKLYFSIEDARLQKYYFHVLPVIRGTIENDEVVVVIHWEVEGQRDLRPPPDTPANRAIKQLFDHWAQGMDVSVSSDIAQEENSAAAPRNALESILREKDSSITKLMSDPQRVGLDDYDRAKALIQEYLDEFSAIVFMDQILDTYG